MACGLIFPSGDHQWKPLIDVAALSGFWQLPLSTMKSLANHLDIEFPVASKAFDLAWVLVQSITGFEDAAVLEILHHRLGGMEQGDSGMAGVILELHEASDILDKEEKREMAKQQEA
eukprot:15466293-Alexandrium_andersonii.AAC.1